MPLVSFQPNRHNMVRDVESIQAGATYKQLLGTTGHEFATLTVESVPTQDSEGKWYMFVTMVTKTTRNRLVHEKVYLSDLGIVPATKDGRWNYSAYLVPVETGQK